MHSFDELILQTRDVLHARDACGSAFSTAEHTLPIPPLDELPIPVGPHVGRGIVLRANTAVELGGTTNDSCALVLATSDTSLVRDGYVSLFGPDIAQLRSSDSAETAVHTPFAQIIFVAGENLAPDDFSALEQCQRAKDYIDGYLVRSFTGQVHSRVSRQLADRGFTFAMLASALSHIVKQACPAAQRVEVAFATEPDRVQRCIPVRDAWIASSHDLRKARWLEKGIDIDCPAGGHCGSCADKATCDRVRAIARMRKERQAVHA